MPSRGVGYAKLLPFLLGCFFFFLLACEQTPPAAQLASALDADAGNEPASWEVTGREDPVTVEDAGTPTIDAGEATVAQCHGRQLRISVSSGLIDGGCTEGYLVIHAWGKDGEEYLSSPDITLTVTIGDDWQGWSCLQCHLRPRRTRSVD
ncbi:MAG: hypothetical protein U0487_01990 [Patescibacteria group bacterium]